MSVTSLLRTGALALPVLLLAAPALVGCSASVSASTDPSYDADELAQKVVDAQLGVTPDLDVTDGTCPADEKLEKGSTLECTISIDGVTAPYTVTVNSVKDGTANFQIDPAQAIVSVAKAEEFITTQATSQGFTGATVDCGDAAVIVQDPGTTFSCTLDFGDGSTQDIEVSIDDLDGNVTLVPSE